MKLTSTPSVAVVIAKRSLISCLTALLAAEILHIGATVANHNQPHAHHGYGPALHVGGVVVTIALLTWTAREGRLAGLLTARLGGVIAVGAVAYHVLPGDLGFNNSFAEGATALQWVSVALGVTVGVTCVVVGLRNHALTGPSQGSGLRQHAPSEVTSSPDRDTAQTGASDPT